MRELTETDLIRGLHRDEVSAFDQLYSKYHQSVYRNIFKLVKDVDAAQDILQEVFIRLWEKRHEIDDERSLSGWLFVLSYNDSINHLRKTLRESLKYHVHINPDLNSCDNEALMLESQYQLLEMAIETLSPQKRKVFTLCKIEGKTYEEAAAELNISKHTVKEYLSLSIVSIKEYINKYPELWKTAILFFIHKI